MAFFWEVVIAAFWMIGGLWLLVFVIWFFQGRVPTGPVRLAFSTGAERARCLETLAAMRKHAEDAGGLLRSRHGAPGVSYEDWAAVYEEAVKTITAALPQLPAPAEKRMRMVLARLAPQGFGDQYPDLPWFEKRLRKLLRAIAGLARDANLDVGR